MVNLYLILGPFPRRLPSDWQCRVYLSPHIVETAETEQQGVPEAAGFETWSELGAGLFPCWSPGHARGMETPPQGGC